MKKIKGGDRLRISHAQPPHISEPIEANNLETSALPLLSMRLEISGRKKIFPRNRTRQCALGPFLRPNMYIWCYWSNLGMWYHFLHVQNLRNPNMMSDPTTGLALKAGFSKGRDRLTCSAQPDHGGMRSDSPRGGITTAGTELMWLIDPKPTNQKETQYSYPHPRASNKISFCWVWSVLDPLWMRLKCSFWLFCYLKSFPHEVQVV